MSVAENVLAMRKKSGLTQQELADKVCVSRPMITQIERGTQIPSVLLARDIAEALGVSIDDLLK